MVGFLLIFVCFVFEFVRLLRLGALLFSHKKVGMRHGVKEDFVVEPNTFEFIQLNKLPLIYRKLMSPSST